MPHGLDYIVVLVVVPGKRTNKMVDKKDTFGPGDVKAFQSFASAGKGFSKAVMRFSKENIAQQKLDKESSKENAKNLKEAKDELKDLNKKIAKGEFVKDVKQEELLKKQLKELEEARKEIGNFQTEELATHNKKQDKVSAALLKVEQEGASYDEQRAHRSAAELKKDKAQELVKEEKDKKRGIIFTKMWKGINGLGEGIKGAFKKVGKAGWIGFKSALLATGILLLINFLNSKKWQEIKASIKKFADEGGFDFIKTTLASVYDWFFGPDSVFKKMGKVFDAFFGEEVWGHEGIEDEGGSFTKGMKELIKQFGTWPIWIAALAVAAIIPGKLGLLIYGTAAIWWGAKGIWTAFTALSGWVGGFAKKIFMGIGAFLKEKWAKSPIKEAFKGIGAKFTSIVTKFKTILTGAIEGAGKWLAELAGKVRKAVPTRFLSKVPDYIKGASRAAMGAGRSIVKPIGAALTHGGKFIKGAAKGGLTGLKAAGAALAGKGKVVKNVTVAAVKAAAMTAGKSAKVAAKFSGFVAKRVPGLGLVLGSGLAALALSQGKYGRAAMEMLSGAASTFPPLGTALSIALDSMMSRSDLGDTQGILEADVKKATERSLAKLAPDLRQKARGRLAVIKGGRGGFGGDMSLANLHRENLQRKHDEEKAQALRPFELRKGESHADAVSRNLKDFYDPDMDAESKKDLKMYIQQEVKSSNDLTLGPVFPASQFNWTPEQAALQMYYLGPGK